MNLVTVHKKSHIKLMFKFDFTLFKLAKNKVFASLQIS